MSSPPKATDHQQPDKSEQLSDTPAPHLPDDNQLPKYEDVIKTTGNFDLTPDDVQVSYSYPASNAGSVSSEHYIQELEVYRNNGGSRHMHVTVGCTNPGCHQQSESSYHGRHHSSSPHHSNDRVDTPGSVRMLCLLRIMIVVCAISACFIFVVFYNI